MPERNYSRRVLEIIKSNKLFLSEREVKMLVRVNINPIHNRFPFEGGIKKYMKVC